MINDTSDNKSVGLPRGTKVRKLYLVLAAVGVVTGVAGAAWLNSLSTPETITTEAYTSTVEYKASGTSDINNPENRTEDVAGSNTDIANPEETADTVAVISEEKRDCTEPVFDDPDKFAVDLGFCDYAVFTINDNGDLEAVTQTDAARQFIDDMSTVVDMTPVPVNTTPKGTGGTATPAPQESNGGSAPAPSQEAAPAPAPAPQPSYCPQSRGENPGVYDACRAGFAMPSGVEFAGISSCSPTGDGGYNVSFQLRLSGGSYGAVDWSGVNGYSGGSATVNTTVYGIDDSDLGHSRPIGSYYVTLYFMSMDGRYGGVIASGSYGDTVVSSLSACG